MSDTFKVSIAFAVSLVVMILAVGRWQGSVDTKITMLFEKVISTENTMRDVRGDIEELEDKFHGHLELCNKP